MSGYEKRAYIRVPYCCKVTINRGLALPVCDGTLLDLNVGAASISMDDTSKTDIDNGIFYIKFILDNDETIRSRATLHLRHDRGAVFLLERGLVLFEIISRIHALSARSTIDRIVSTRKFRAVVEQRKAIQKPKMNCWEFKACGREKHCPAGRNEDYDGILGGKNGGRFCAFVPGTLSRDYAVRTQEGKFSECVGCEFYKELLEDSAKQPDKPYGF
ncbi:MAG: hypothetical protein HQL63_07435 [Magnetococcales bacterium]|nr:hypothetical protein [Magnetococcales bacterium]MBF0322323.1 hypothetical protein [Magnetococcales bacterium]